MAEDIVEVPRNGACHCGAVRFRVRLWGGLTDARRCDCSFCRMRGAVAVTAKREHLEILAGEGHLTKYQFNTSTAEHYFCGVCGIYTHHRRRSNPNEYGVNAACLEDVSPFDFDSVTVMDGRNHPADVRPPGDGVVGELRFVRRGASGD